MYIVERSKSVSITDRTENLAERNEYKIKGFYREKYPVMVTKNWKYQHKLMNI